MHGPPLRQPDEGGLDRAAGYSYGEGEQNSRPAGRLFQARSDERTESEGSPQAKHLADGIGENPRPGTVVLYGNGGFGKTTLAAALCHEDAAITAFDAGVLWVTLGENPNLVAELTKLYAALTGQRPDFVDAEDAAFNLGQRLGDASYLLVIDDVWDVARLRPFLGDDGCPRRDDT